MVSVSALALMKRSSFSPHRLTSLFACRRPLRRPPSTRCRRRWAETLPAIPPRVRAPHRANRAQLKSYCSALERTSFLLQARPPAAVRVACTASNIRMYPVQRQRLPARPSRICSIVGCGYLREMLRREDHARRADAALRPAVFQKALLDRMQLARHAPCLRSCRSSRPPPAAPAPGSCSPARRSSAPSTSRTRLRRSLPSFRSGAGLRAARRAAASSAEPD